MDVRARLDELAEAAWGLAVVSASAECGLLARLSTPARVDQAAEVAGMPVELAERVLDVLVVLGFARRLGDSYLAVDQLRPMLTDEGVQQLRAELRTTLQQSRDLVDRAARHTLVSGWVHTDPDLLRAQGAAGRAAARMMASQGIQRLPGLVERLNAPTARFLDVGAGVGVIAIEMCRTYPSLQVVGLEPAQAPRREALRQIAMAGLSDRIEIRDQSVEALTDTEEFDFAYVPQVFLPDDAFLRGLETVWRALRPGGWVSLPVISAPGNEVRPAVARLQNTLWGGRARLVEDVAEAATGAGFVEVQTRSLGGTRHAVTGRRPEETGARPASCDAIVDLDGPNAKQT